MTQPDTTQLHRFLVDHFNLEELKTLCFNLGIEYEDLGGEGRSDKARELVRAMQRRTRLEHLVAHLSIARPDAYRQRFRETPAIPATQVRDRRIHEKTGIELIRIPVGPFLYGNKSTLIELTKFWIGRAPVTNDQFSRFVRATGYETEAECRGYGLHGLHAREGRIEGAEWQHPRGPESSIIGKIDYPVVQVSWRDAQAFCNWAGLALPTEEQWEKAARGRDGRIWPWGNESPTADHCNFNVNVGDTTPVGRYSPLGDSPYDCVDMAGNVLEWTGYRTGWEFAVAKGGAWLSDAEACQCGITHYGVQSVGHTGMGFRVVEVSS